MAEDEAGVDTDGMVALGQRLSNWGRWGPDDERGTLNFVTPETVTSALSCACSGRVFELSIEISGDGPWVTGPRQNPQHLMNFLPGDLFPPEKLMVADDTIIMALQATTQWDGLAHVGYDQYLYNGVSIGSVTARFGATRNSIDRVLPGMVGRGVLLDVARHRGVEWLTADAAPVQAAELDEIAHRQGVEIRSGDAVLVRTGWRRKAVVEGFSEEWITVNPGLHLDCAEWLHDLEAATAACDNWGFEHQPSPNEGDLYPLHCVLIRDMGMMIGEMFDFEELAADCSEDGQWDFFFSAPPLRVAAAVGSPVSPIAVK